MHGLVGRDAGGPLRPRSPAHRARSCRRWPVPPWSGCGTRRARACSSTCGGATAGCAWRRWSRPTACVRSSPWGRRCRSTWGRRARSSGAIPRWTSRGGPRASRSGNGAWRRPAPPCSGPRGEVVAAVSVSGPIERTTRSPGPPVRAGPGRGRPGRRAGAGAGDEASRRRSGTDGHPWRVSGRRGSCDRRDGRGAAGPGRRAVGSGGRPRRRRRPRRPRPVRPGGAAHGPHRGGGGGLAGADRRRRRPHRGGRGQRPGRRLRPGGQPLGPGAGASRSGCTTSGWPPLGDRVYLAGGYHNRTPAAAWEPQSRVAQPGSGRDGRGGRSRRWPRPGAAWPWSRSGTAWSRSGGTGAAGDVLRRTEVLTPGRWVAGVPGPDLTEPRDHLAAAASGGRVYAIAGRQGSLESNLATVESWDPAAGRGLAARAPPERHPGRDVGRRGQRPAVRRRRRGAPGHHRLGGVPGRRPVGAGGDAPGAPPRPGRRRPGGPAARHRRRTRARPVRQHRPRGLRHRLTRPARDRSLSRQGACARYAPKTGRSAARFWTRRDVAARRPDQALATRRAVSRRSPGGRPRGWRR